MPDRPLHTANLENPFKQLKVNPSTRPLCFSEIMLPPFSERVVKCVVISNWYYQTNYMLLALVKYV